MEIDQKQHYRSKDERLETARTVDEENEGEATSEKKDSNDIGEVAPGITIIRNCTPRPLTLGSILSTLSTSGQPLRVQQEEVPPNFPTRAPSAPPLPEELGGQEEEAPVSTAGTTSHIHKSAVEEPQEFDWLFEYGLEMDTTILNSPERLDGLALLYGPATLKGYSILLGSVGTYGEQDGGKRTIATIVPGPEPNAEVWGVLYRIPRRLRVCVGDEPSLLDTIHSAGTTQALFRPVQAVVHETYRDRDIACVTYIATDTAQQRLKPLAAEQGNSETLFVQRLTTIVKKLGLPDRHLSTYTARVAQSNDERNTDRVAAATIAQMNLNTEPLLALEETSKTPSPFNNRHAMQTKKKVGGSPTPWLIGFAVYLGIELLIVLTFAVLQGMGFASALLTNNFTLLGVPWLVLAYGLLGGSISSIVTLGRARIVNPPTFIVITWFSRPYVGAALALLSYLLLTSGLFVFGTSYGTHSALFQLIGALAGLCEGWIFMRKRS